MGGKSRKAGGISPKLIAAMKQGRFPSLKAKTINVKVKVSISEEKGTAPLL